MVLEEIVVRLAMIFHQTPLLVVVANEQVVLLVGLVMHQAGPQEQLVALRT